MRDEVRARGFTHHSDSQAPLAGGVPSAASPSAAADPMVRGPAGPSLLIWMLVVGYCAFGFVYAPLVALRVVGPATLSQLMLFAAGVLGLTTLLRIAGSSERTVSRAMCRVLMIYLLYELLLVLPVALWLGGADFGSIVGTMTVRFSWLLFPIMLTVCADERARRLAGMAVIVAAAGLVAWGAYLAMTGGGGYFLDNGELRFRILPGTIALMAAFPFVLVVSGAVPRRHTVPLLAIAGLGLLLANHRSAVVAFAVAGLVCVALAGNFRRVLPVMVPTALVAVIIYLVWEQQLGRMLGYTLTRMFDVTSGTGLDRATRWRLAWDFSAHHPFNDLVWSWQTGARATGDAESPHNFVLEVLGREGVAGLVFYGTLLLGAMRSGWSRARSDAEVRALLGWLVFYVVFSLANANHYDPTSMPLLVAAIAATASRVDWLDRSSAQSSDGHAAAAVQM